MSRYDIVGVGNALVDILSHCDDGFLSTHGVEKGIMQLIDADRAVELYSVMGPATTPALMGSSIPANGRTVRSVAWALRPIRQGMSMRAPLLMGNGQVQEQCATRTGPYQAVSGQKAA